MRALAVVLLACTGCPGGGGGDDGDCTIDSDCGTGNVCTRNTECLPASEVRSARITWTIRGMPASDALCASTPSFFVLFAGTQLNDTFGYEPVPCKAGVFSIDKLPRRFVSVELGVANGISERNLIDDNQRHDIAGSGPWRGSGCCVCLGLGRVWFWRGGIRLSDYQRW